MTKHKTTNIEKSTILIEKKINVSDPQKLTVKSKKQGKLSTKIKQSTPVKKVPKPCPLVMKEDLLNSERFIENKEDELNRTIDLRSYVEFGSKDLPMQIKKDLRQDLTACPVKRENEIVIVKKTLEKTSSSKDFGFNSSSPFFNKIFNNLQDSDKKDTETEFCLKNNQQLKQIGQLLKLKNFKENLARQRYEKWMQELARKCYIDPHELYILQTLPRRKRINIFDPKNILLDELQQYKLKPNSVNQNDDVFAVENDKPLNTSAPKFKSKRAERFFKRKLRKYFEADSNSKYL